MLPIKLRFIWPIDLREDVLEINQSETRIACCTVFVNGLWKVLYKECSFHPSLLTNTVQQAILVSDWLISRKSSPLKPLGQTNRNLVGSILGRSSIKIAHLVQKQELPMVAMLVNESELNEQSL
jgi:hypothetical protein